MQPHAADDGNHPWDDLTDGQRTEMVDGMLPVVEAAAAVIRGQIAGEIETRIVPDPHREDEACETCRVMREAAGIARGET
jgi:hypothetical protein